MEITMSDPETGKTYLTNPSRDIAWFGPQIFELIAERCKPENLRMNEKAALDQQNIPHEKVLEGWLCIAKFHELAVNPDVKTVPDAITQSGFTDLPYLVQMLIHQRYSQAMLGAIWAGLRSSTMNEMCPAVVSNLKLRAEELSNFFEKQ